MSETVKTPWHLWVVGILALLWNAGGAFDFVMTVTGNEAYMGQFTEAQLDFFYSFPAWVVAVWAIAVTAAVIGSIFLLLRSAAAERMFWLSLFAMLITAVHNYFISDVSMTEVVGPGALAFSAAIVVITIALALYARWMTRRGVLK